MKLTYLALCLRIAYPVPDDLPIYDDEYLRKYISAIWRGKEE